MKAYLDMLSAFENGTEEYLLECVTEFCGPDLTAILDQIAEEYLSRPVSNELRRCIARLYQHTRNLDIVLQGKVVTSRDCGPQLLVLLLEALPPESFVQAISWCEDLRFDLLWAFFGHATEPERWAQSVCWGLKNPAIAPENRGQPDYNTAMRHKLMSVGTFLLNYSRSNITSMPNEPRYSTFFSSWARQEMRCSVGDEPAMPFAIHYMLQKYPREFMQTLTGRSISPNPDINKLASQCTPVVLRALLAGKTPGAAPEGFLLRPLLEVSPFV